MLVVEQLGKRHESYLLSYSPTGWRGAAGTQRTKEQQQQEFNASPSHLLAVHLTVCRSSSWQRTTRRGGIEPFRLG